MGELGWCNSLPLQALCYWLAALPAGHAPIALPPCLCFPAGDIYPFWPCFRRWIMQRQPASLLVWADFGVCCATAG